MKRNVFVLGLLVVGLLGFVGNSGAQLTTSNEQEMALLDDIIKDLKTKESEKAEGNSNDAVLIVRSLERTEQDLAKFSKALGNVTEKDIQSADEFLKNQRPSRNARESVDEVLNPSPEASRAHGIREFGRLKKERERLIGKLDAIARDAKNPQSAIAYRAMVGIANSGPMPASQNPVATESIKPEGNFAAARPADTPSASPINPPVRTSESPAPKSSPAAEKRGDAKSSGASNLWLWIGGVVAAFFVWWKFIRVPPFTGTGEEFMRQRGMQSRRPFD